MTCLPSRQVGELEQVLYNERMSAQRYRVETIQGSTAVLTDNAALGEIFVSHGDMVGLEIVVHSPESLSQLLRSNTTLPTVDSWIIFLTPSLGSYFLGEGRAIWQALTTYPHPHLYLVEPEWQQLPLELPSHASLILLGEYLGLDQVGSPTLDQIAQLLGSAGTVTLGEGGLSSLHLMSESRVLEALAAIINNNLKSPVINVGNPDSTTLASLLQNLIPTLGQKLNISYDDGGLTATVPSNFYRTTHSILEKLSPESTLDLAINYLKSIKPKTIKPAKPDPTPPPSLAPKPATHQQVQRYKPTPVVDQVAARPRPRNLSALEFVPTSKPKAKRKLEIHIPAALKSNRLKFALRGVLYGLIFYLGSLALALGISLVTLQSLNTQVQAGRIENLSSNKVAVQAGNYLYGNSVAWGTDELTLLLDAHLQALSIAGTAGSLGATAQKLSSYVLSGGEDNIAALITSTRIQVEDLYQKISLLDAALPLEPPDLISSQKDQYQALKSSFPELKKQTLLAKGIISILPDLIAIEGRAKYLVLFQNNMELRATGGFIGSYGILSFESGRLYDFQVYDVYTADGALKGHVEPPAPIKDILGEAKWYLRDSNFDPDFPTSARRAEWFLKKSMNTDVDGTISVNLETLQMLLDTVGPLEVPDYNETINAGNLAERAQFHSEVNFFPGSTAKKEFLSSIGSALFQKLKSLDSLSLFRASSAITKSLESSDTQVSVLDPVSERVLNTLGWSGSLDNSPCPGTPCFDDYLYAVDSNFGVNKANFYITKKTHLNIVVDKDGLPTHTLTTTWTNSAKSSAWPAGAYKNYSRLYLPISAIVRSVKIGERELAADEWTISPEHGRNVLSYLITVPIDSALESTVIYTNPTAIKSGSLYSLYLKRQGGTRPEDPMSVTIELPLYLKAIKISPEANFLSPQKIEFNFSLDSDRRVTLQF